MTFNAADGKEEVLLGALRASHTSHAFLSPEEFEFLCAALAVRPSRYTKLQRRAKGWLIAQSNGDDTLLINCGGRGMGVSRPLRFYFQVLKRTNIQANVKWFDPSKGYGFITIPEQQDLFLHIKNVVSEGHPYDGALVEFEIGNDERLGRRVALNVQVIRQ